MLRIAQQQRFRRSGQRALLIGFRIELLQIGTRFRQLALMRQHPGDAQLGAKRLFAIHRAIPLLGFVPTFAFLAQLAKIKAHRIVVFHTGVQRLAQIHIGRIVVLQLHGEQTDGEWHFGATGEISNQPLKFFTRLRIVFFLH